ncbi:MAG: hypothetical protein RDV48_24295 [Candidatus Eremiobacteraeota bacterium]|nr:hypothetical protein [Candidatus Eremiobacteraeota bacterium]
MREKEALTPCLQVSLPVGPRKSVKLSRDEGLLIEGKAGKVTWMSLKGSFVHYRAHYAGESLKLLGEGAPFICTGAGTWLNAMRLRSILWTRKEKCYWLTLDSGVPQKGSGGGSEPLRVRVHPAMGKKIADALGLPHLYHVEPFPELHRALWEEGLRDYNVELIRMESGELRRCFDDSGKVDVERLTGNLLWQLYRYRIAGREPSYEVTTPRGFLYRPLLVVLNRLGLTSAGVFAASLNIPGTLTSLELPDGAPSPEIPGPPGAPGAREKLFRIAADSPLWPFISPAHGPEVSVMGAGATGTDYWYALLLRTLVELSAKRRFFTYRDLGFEDVRPDLRCIGEKHPRVVLVIEKYSLSKVLHEAGGRLGISAVILGGNPSWIPTEYFCDALKGRLEPSDPVHLVSLVDYDPFGWLLVEMFREQLERYGVKAASVRHLVVPSRFSAEEIRQVSYQVESPHEAIRGKIRKWMEAGGGIEGKPRGIHADDLWPHERIWSALEEVCRGLLEGEKGMTSARRALPEAPPAPVEPSPSIPYGAMDGPLFAKGLPRLVVQGDIKTGLVLLPPGEVASIRPEHGGRLELVTVTGDVFHLSKGTGPDFNRVQEAEGICGVAED